MPDDTPPRTTIEAAAAWLKSEQTGTEEQAKKLRLAGDSEGSKGVTIEAGLLSAQSNRELAAATMNAAEVVSFAVHDARVFLDINAQAMARRLDCLNQRIDTFTTKADEGTQRLANWTRWLVWATAVLSAAAIAAAIIQSYFMVTSPVQIVIVGKPGILP